MLIYGLLFLSDENSNFIEKTEWQRQFSPLLYEANTKKVINMFDNFYWNTAVGKALFHVEGVSHLADLSL